MATKKGRRGKRGRKTKHPVGFTVAPAPKKARAPRLKYGSIGTQLRHAFYLLSATDYARLERLCLLRPADLADNDEIDLGTVRNPMSPGEAVEIEREELFAKARRARHAKECADPIGRAWLAGLLEGHGADPIVLREAGREYGHLYWQELRVLDSRIGNYEGYSSRSRGKEYRVVGNNGYAGHRWRLYENALDGIGPGRLKIRAALHSLCVDNCWFIAGPEWLDRIISGSGSPRGGVAVARGVHTPSPQMGPIERPGDRDTLALAVRGLLALTIGADRAAAA